MKIKKNVLIFISVIAAISISAYLAPIIYSIFPQFKFERILNRLLIISTFILCFSFVRIDSSFFKACGFNQKQNIAFNRWAQGFFVSFFVLLLLIFTEYKLGVLLFSETFSFSVSLFALSALTGILVGAVEEFFFRGLLYLNLSRRWDVWPSVILTSLVYSAVHFLKSGRPLIDAPPTMWDSFRVLGASFQAFWVWQETWPAFIGLFLFGIVLNFAFLRTRSLFMSMGLHAGAVFLLKLFSRWYIVNPDYSSLVFGGRGFYSGVLGWTFIAFIGFLVYYLSASTFSPKRR